jgi:hypothetical protein
MAEIKGNLRYLQVPLCYPRNTVVELILNTKVQPEIIVISEIIYNISGYNCIPKCLVVCHSQLWKATALVRPRTT